MKNVLAVVLVVSVASIALSQNPPPKSQGQLVAEGLAQARGEKPEHRQRWEYKISQRGGHTQQPEVWEKTLNEMAAEGWELDQINQDLFYIFRRPVQQPAVRYGDPLLKDANELLRSKP